MMRNGAILKGLNHLAPTLGVWRMNYLYPERVASAGLPPQIRARASIVVQNIGPYSVFHQGAPPVPARPGPSHRTAPLPGRHSQPPRMPRSRRGRHGGSPASAGGYVPRLHRRRHGKGAKARLLALDQDQVFHYGGLCLAKRVWHFLDWLFANQPSAALHHRPSASSPQAHLPRRIPSVVKALRNRI